MTINEQRLQPMVPFTLTEGDLVQLGQPEQANSKPPFVWRFRNKMRVIKVKGQQSESHISLSQTSDHGSSQASDHRSSHMKRKREPEESILPSTSKTDGCSPCKRGMYLMVNGCANSLIDSSKSG